VTQVELAKTIGSSQANISYYESDRGQAPPLVLAKIARALGVSTDEILGLDPIRLRKPREKPIDKRLWNRFQLLTHLPERDQKAVMRMINSLAQANGFTKKRGRTAVSYNSE
jgi:transcriptional regulator with XRE-family HTH domain